MPDVDHIPFEFFEIGDYEHELIHAYLSKHLAAACAAALNANQMDAALGNDERPSYRYWMGLANMIETLIKQWEQVTRASGTFVSADDPAKLDRAKEAVDAKS